MKSLPTPKYNLIGHRGVGGLRPENTLCSFSYAAELGLNWIEFDVQLSSDDRWIVMHDDTLDRTTSGRGLVRKWPADEIIDLEAGLWFKPPFPGQKVPTLLETLKLAKKLNLFCNVEIKGAELDPSKCASLFAATVTEHPELFNQGVITSSFTLDCITQLRPLSPDLPIGYLVENFSHQTISTTLANQFSSINCNVEKITRDDVKAASLANIPVFLYTVNDQTTAKFWLDNGVTGLFTDRPDLLHIL